MSSLHHAYISIICNDIMFDGGQKDMPQRLTVDLDVAYSIECFYHIVVEPFVHGTLTDVHAVTPSILYDVCI